MIIHRMICDRCKKSITPDDIVEWQERHCMSGEGGYGSAFGDGQPWAVDLCDACAYAVLSEFIPSQASEAGK